MASENTKIKRCQVVVKDNELIQRSTYALNATQQKLVAYLISMIKPTDTELKEYTIRVEDFCELTGIDKNHFYMDFLKLVESFDEKRFWVETETEIYRFYWFSDVCYIKGSGEIKITLSKRLSKYLIGLSENFTRYELWDVLGLSGKYSIRLFELFKSYAYQRRKEFTVDDLKDLLQANTSSYKNYANFRTRVLDPAIKEINKFTELEVKYSEIRQGKKVVKIVFMITQKENPERYTGYINTMRKLDEENGQVAGQLSMSDIFDV